MSDLLLGVGVSDRASSGDDPVADAVAAEVFGYDFVSTFDHPVSYAATADVIGAARMRDPDHPDRAQPTFETQTLLTWIAARTTRIGIVPRVLGVPFRPPALVAKSAETLQRLSNGRLFLGLGGGLRDDEIRAVGGPDPSTNGRADGLEDAIAIIKAAWTEDVVDYNGPVYAVEDLELEPKPPAPIPIWLGATGPRGLELTGRVADGWIPFLRFTKPAQVRDMLDRIRASAVAAGRPADAVRAVYTVPVRIGAPARTTPHMVTGSATEVVEQLRDLTELGFTGFDLMPDRDQLQLVAAEVVPALRDLWRPGQPDEPLTAAAL